MNKKELQTAAQILGSRGGKNRASRYSKKQLREWAALGGKAGGRPKGSKDTKPRKKRSEKAGTK
jgi:hypothetical protein